jgi:hypothetical protein
MTAVCLEFGVGAHVDDVTLAWVHDVRRWALCGQGVDEASALADLTARAHPSYARILERHGEIARALEGLEIVERIHGDELTLHRDHGLAADEELQRTTEILAYAREELVALIEDCSGAELDARVRQGADSRISLGQLRPVAFTNGPPDALPADALRRCSLEHVRGRGWRWCVRQLAGSRSRRLTGTGTGQLRLAPAEPSPEWGAASSLNARG